MKDIINDCIKQPKMIDLYIKIAMGNVSYTKDKNRNKIISKKDNDFIIICIILKIAHHLHFLLDK